LGGIIVTDIKGRLLGLDYGSKRMGVAVSDPLGITAQSLPAIRRQGDRKDIETLAALVGEYGIQGFVLGLPLHEDGNEGTMAAAVQRFAAKLRETTGLPVEMWDERFTTAQAERHLVESGVRRDKRKELRDSLSAAFILQGVLDLRNRK
jgi:putative Holliday junction resolvase